MAFTFQLLKSDYAGHVPLRIIAERILAHHAADQFGDFRGTLLGLLAAYAYESSILAAATRLVSSDAFQALFSLYQSHVRSTLPSKPEAEPQDSSDQETAAAAGESSAAGPSSLADSGTAGQRKRTSRMVSAALPVRS